DLDAYLHKPQNAGIHQKSLAKILTSLSPIIAQIIEQGNEEGVFHCRYPLELSETILSVFCFLLDPGIFTWTPEQIERKLTILVSILE
ncbi:TetR/AcrR family transcriptional regulator, partial [Erysipelatoclostridium ramosum]|nr:TetR/AcrR family transcriptional regulator [Thomasclavelia ramosa]